MKRILGGALLLFSLAPRTPAAEVEMERQFAQSVRPLLTTYCVGCHSGANAAAQFDLKQYTTVADVVRDHGRWSLVAEKLMAMEMPPKAMKQPSETERKQLVEWVETVRLQEARRNAGDPG